MTKSRSCGIRMMCLLLSLVCLIGAFPAEVRAEEIPETEEINVISTSLVYTSASASSRVIGRLEEGTEITVLSTGSEYYKIDCFDTNGYIASSQVTQREGKYFVSCQPESSHTANMELRGSMEALLFRTAVMELAKTELGDPYVYGATGPNSFDCSGFTSYIYKNTDHPLARICSGQMAQGVIVSREELQPGDLIFFGDSPGSVFHVGIYAGDGEIIHASSSKGISYADLDSPWFAGNYLCARRMIPTVEQSEPEAASALMIRK